MSDSSRLSSLSQEDVEAGFVAVQLLIHLFKPNPNALSTGETMTTMQAISRFLGFVLWCIYQLAGWLSLPGFLEFKVVLCCS
ncbi:MAG: hypothetical protein ACREBU_21005 [Nitrososphaera sp.]